MAKKQWPWPTKAWAGHRPRGHRRLRGGAAAAGALHLVRRLRLDLPQAPSLGMGAVWWDGGTGFLVGSMGFKKRSMDDLWILYESRGYYGLYRFVVG